MSIEGLTLIEVTAKGYHSGKTETCAVVVDRSFVEEYADDFGSVWFSELDGKHSEVEGVVTLLDLNASNIKEAIKTYLNANADDYKVWEELFVDVDEDDINKQMTVDAMFGGRVNSERDYYLDGELL